MASKSDRWAVPVLIVSIGLIVLSAVVSRRWLGQVIAVAAGLGIYAGLEMLGRARSWRKATRIVYVLMAIAVVLLAFFLPANASAQTAVPTTWGSLKSMYDVPSRVDFTRDASRTLTAVNTSVEDARQALYDVYATDGTLFRQATVMTVEQSIVVGGIADDGTENAYVLDRQGEVTGHLRRVGEVVVDDSGRLIYSGRLDPQGVDKILHGLIDKAETAMCAAISAKVVAMCMKMASGAGAVGALACFGLGVAVYAGCEALHHIKDANEEGDDHDAGGADSTGSGSDSAGTEAAGGFVSTTVACAYCR